MPALVSFCISIGGEPLGRRRSSRSSHSKRYFPIPPPFPRPSRKVVWERLLVGGDDLRSVALFTLAARLTQTSMVAYIVYHVIVFPHDPEIFVLTGCISHEDSYWLSYRAAIGVCFVMLAYGLVGTFVEVAMFVVSGRGTPTETETRRMLVPLCKFNMVRMKNDAVGTSRCPTCPT